MNNEQMILNILVLERPNVGVWHIFFYLRVEIIIEQSVHYHADDRQDKIPRSLSRLDLDPFDLYKDVMFANLMKRDIKSSAFV